MCSNLKENSGAKGLNLTHNVFPLHRNMEDFVSHSLTQQQLHGLLISNVYNKHLQVTSQLLTKHSYYISARWETLRAKLAYAVFRHKQ